jgi:hypothetical protein
MVPVGAWGSVRSRFNARGAIRTSAPRYSREWRDSFIASRMGTSTVRETGRGRRAIPPRTARGMDSCYTPLDTFRRDSGQARKVSRRKSLGYVARPATAPPRHPTAIASSMRAASIAPLVGLWRRLLTLALFRDDWRNRDDPVGARAGDLRAEAHHLTALVHVATRA